MKHLLENWSEVKGRLRTPIFLLADYDGTLTPIVDRPEEAVLSERTRKPLSRLADICPVGVVSGRALKDVQKKVGIEDIYYVGNHGFEIIGPRIEHFLKGAGVKSIIVDLCAKIREKTKTIKGVLVENKGVTASIHYRLASDDHIARVEEIFKKVTGPYRQRDEVNVTRGKKVLEIRPSLKWDKGRAISWLLEATGYGQESFPIYLGDDVTDEDAFEASKEMGGFGILVSQEEKESKAEYVLNNSGEVEIFLELLADYLSSKEK